MPTKAEIAIVAALIIGSTVAASANEVPENRVDHKYP